MDKNKIKGVTAAARFMHVSPNTVRVWMANGKLNGCYHRLSPRIIYFDRDKLDEVIWGKL